MKTNTKKTSKSDKVKVFFNNCAKTYVNHFNQEIIYKIINDLNIKPDQTLIEAGSGSSDFTPYLLKRLGHIGKIYCIDLSEKMINEGRKKISDNRVIHIVGDVSQYPLYEFGPKLIICFNMYPHIDDKNAFIDHAYRSLNINGSLVICHDKTREQIVDIHQRHNVDKSISDFPETETTIQLLIRNKLKICKIVTDPYYFILATKI